MKSLCTKGVQNPAGLFSVEIKKYSDFIVNLQR
jgi:hypothetical protein